jgi:GNAT superfamily N-acetyltransferase
MQDIRKATTEDLEQVRQWLQQETDAGHDSFIVNFNFIQEGQRDDSLTVLLDQELPIAFALGKENLSIFAVKRDRRGDGVGTALASHWFQAARDRDLIGFDGECSPETSLRFWKKMGCTQIASRSPNPWVIMPFKKSRDLPEGLEVVSLTFELHDSDGNAIPEWDVITAAVIEVDDYMLAEDFVAYVPTTDVRLTIWGDDEWIWDGKVRDIEDIGGDRKCHWIRVRDLCPPKGES